MLVVMQEGATEPQIAAVEEKLTLLGYAVHRITGVENSILGGVGPDKADPAEFDVLPGVKECMRVSSPYKLASRSMRPGGTIIKVGDVEIGGNQMVVMGGPCSVEGRDQFFTCTEMVAKAGAKIVRGGAFKPRSSPYSFQGMGEEGLQIMREAGDHFGVKVISEVMDTSQINMMLPYVDIFQVGARNMQNFNLLKALGAIRKPILLKRGIAATVEEWLLSAEYILAGGNYDVMLCERGIRTYETFTRNTMDISAIPVVKKLSHLPIVADPSHGTGRRDMVLPMALASVAAGADGLIVEMHNNPDKAFSDGAQSLFPEQFTDMVERCRVIAPAVGRTI